jgi:hypothetical protein
MTFRRLRARLDRLESTTPGQDRERDRIRRHELQYRKIGREKLTGREEAELQVLDTLFYDEDRDRERMMELAFKEISVFEREPLTDDEAQELAELGRRYPPHPAMEEANRAIRQALERWGSDR